MDPRIMAAMQTNPQFQNLLQRIIQWQAMRNQYARPMQPQAPFVGQPQYNGPPSQMAPNQIVSSPAASPPVPLPGGEGGAPPGNAYGFYGTPPPQGNAYGITGTQPQQAPQQQQGNAYAYGQPARQAPQQNPAYGQPEQGYGSDKPGLRRPDMNALRQRYGR